MSPNTDKVKQRAKSNLPAIYFAYATVFLFTMGIGVITPVIPDIISPLISNPTQLAWVAGLLQSTYALCQFISAPGLGALSDRFGRRPILLICILGSSIGYVLFGIGTALALLFIGRIIDGITGGNISTLFAYVADMTEPSERSIYFGRLGAAAGLGFVFGPVIGGTLAVFGSHAPLYCAAGLAFINFLLGLFIMQETHLEKNRSTSFSLRQLNPFSQLRNLIALPNLYWLLSITLLYFISFAILQSNIAVFAKDMHGWSPQNISWIFLMIGIESILVQGFLIKWMLTKWSDLPVAILGLVLLSGGLALVALSAVLTMPMLILAGIGAFGFGDAVAAPTLQSLISRAVGPDKQGMVQGGNQSVTALGRVIGPLIGGQLYVAFGAIFPYLLASVAMALAILIVQQHARQLRAPQNGEAVHSH